MSGVHRGRSTREQWKTFLLEEENFVGGQFRRRHSQPSSEGIQALIFMLHFHSKFNNVSIYLSFYPSIYCLSITYLFNRALNQITFPCRSVKLGAGFLHCQLVNTQENLFPISPTNLEYKTTAKGGGKHSKHSKKKQSFLLFKIIPSIRLSG